jgi:hypothetical protein
MASSEPSRKRGREEVPPPPPTEPEKVPLPPPTEPEEVPPPTPAQGGEAAPVQGGAAARGAHVCSFSKCVGCLLVSEDAPPSFPEFWKGGRSSRVQQPTHKPSRSMSWLGSWREECSPLSTTTMATTMAASTSLALAPAPTPTVGLLRRRLPLLN